MDAEMGDSQLILSADAPAWKGKSVVTVSQFDEEALTLVIRTAEMMRLTVEQTGGSTALQGKVLATVFYEPSTRTSCSFQSAMLRLGGTVVAVDSSTSSATKGETLEDTMRCMACYCDGIVLRHPVSGAALRAAEAVPGVSVVNAGDGVGEHPTQALLDLYTLWREFAGRTVGAPKKSARDTLQGKTIALVGDLKHGRTVHSLAKLLARFEVKLLYVSPEALAMPEDVTSVVAHGTASQRACGTLAEAVVVADAIYVTRVQKERFATSSEYEALKGTYVVDAAIMATAKPTCAVLHPLPRVDEISTDFDSDPRAAYFRQMQNGMYVRMALLKLLLG